MTNVRNRQGWRNLNVQLGKWASGLGNQNQPRIDLQNTTVSSGSG